jgi:hypothetical protein
MKSTSAFLIAVLTFLSCGQPDTGGCSKDTDCAYGRVCSSRVCVDRVFGNGTGGGWGSSFSSGGGSSSSSGGGASGGCTSDGECRGRCVSGKCVDCKSDADCQSFGQCYEVSRSNCLGSSDCPDQLGLATCSGNRCSCPNVYPQCGEEICGWRFQ